MELKSRKLEFTHDGEKHSLRFPSVGEIQSYTDKEKKKGSDTFALAVDFVSGLGIEKEKLLKMEAANFEKVVDALIGEKKS